MSPDPITPTQASHTHVGLVRCATLNTIFDESRIHIMRKNRPLASPPVQLVTEAPEFTSVGQSPLPLAFLFFLFSCVAHECRSCPCLPFLQRSGPGIRPHRAVPSCAQPAGGTRAHDLRPDHWRHSGCAHPSDANPFPFWVLTVRCGADGTGSDARNCAQDSERRRHDVGVVGLDEARVRLHGRGLAAERPVEGSRYRHCYPDTTSVYSQLERNRHHSVGCPSLGFDAGGEITGPTNWAMASARCNRWGAHWSLRACAVCEPLLGRIRLSGNSLPMSFCARRCHFAE